MSLLVSDPAAPGAHTQAWSTITNTPTTLSGYGITDAQGLDSDLTALAGLSSNGLIARTGSGTAAVRTITGTANQVIVTNGDGVNGNPTLSLPQDIATGSTPTFGGLSTSGSITSTASEAMAVKHDTGFIGFYDTGGATLEGYLQYIGSTGAMRLASNVGGLDFCASGSSKMVITSAGKVGIGLITPSTTLDIVASSATNSSFGIRAFAGTSADDYAFNLRNRTDSQTFMYVRGDGNVGIGTDTPSAQLHVSGGNVRFSNYGAGTLVTDSSGNVTASSDSSLKTVTGSFTRGLADVLKLTPRTYHWNEKSGMDTEDENVGFIAQEVIESIPEAVGQYRTSEVEVDGEKTKKREKAELLTLSDRPLIAALVNAVKELKSENDELRNRIDKLEAKK